MKTIFWMSLCALMLAPSLHFGQSKAPNKFYKKYKTKNASMNMTVPGWLIDLGANIAILSTDDREEKEALKLMKKIKRLKVLVLEDGSNLKDKHVKDLFSRLRKDNYEDLVQIRDDGSAVNIMIREEQDMIKNLFVLVRESDEEAVMLSMKTNLKMEQINDMLNMMEDEMDVELN